ncbi:hypothetical protein F1B92_00530 [Campylobacter sp. FMV-PI01]|uniref:Periplasmic protein n=1 Tax=Campylobacter portucalensis TaxID=2608384 RepID=A0A6L5WHL0_9BACT|nr:hypothetical protein [Campylobacter portucalensis]MSN95697.1 hypothetical protein [Campylobacter portucalensis]
MVKKAFWIVFLSIFLIANESDIKEIEKSEDFITVFDKKTPIVLKFNSNSTGTLLIKTISNLLEKLGFNDFYDLNFKNSSNSSYSVIVYSTKLPHPRDIKRNLQKDGVIVTGVKKTNQAYEYSIDMTNASIETEIFDSSYKKPIKPYFINVSNIKSIEILAQNDDIWHPSIQFFDRNLNLIDEKIIKTRHVSLNLDILENTHYILVGDDISMEKISKGLKFNIK